MNIEVSNGEIVDKLTIIEIKLLHIADAAKRSNLQNELAVLEKAVTTFFNKQDVLYQKLYNINLKLWQIEDACRLHEQKQLFDEAFIQIARSVYITNDERALVKKQINEATGSNLTEVKSYQ
jgi:Family of unknown function (DUF6165)